MPLSPNGKQVSALLLGVVMGSVLVGGGLVMWASSSQKDQQMAELAKKVEAMASGQARVESALDALRDEIQPAAAHGSMMGRATVASPPGHGYYKKETTNVLGDSLSLPGIDSEETGDEITQAQSVIGLSYQEAERVTPILEKLRSPYGEAYPDLPTIMSSPERAALTLAGRNKVMGEIAQMLENGELDPAVFFPQQVNSPSL